MTSLFDIRNYGATGDGTSKDTLAVQQAIDACSGAGGGKVYAPPGVYVIGTIVLKDNVEIHLESGATLLGSPDRHDYDASHNLPADTGYTFEKVGAEHLIIAVGATNIALTGRGLIDGNAQAFMDLDKKGLEAIYGWRPGQMVCLCGCTNVTIRDLNFRNPTYWTIRTWGCTSVVINGIRIDNSINICNGDGIDVDACRDVVISDCIINSSDDSITLRACELDGLPRRDCENITVSNCILSTPCSCVRVGVGNGTIRNATFSNIVMRNIAGNGHGIDFMPWKLSALGDVGPDAELPEEDPVSEDISFSNIQMQAEVPFRLWSGEDDGEHRGKIRRVSFAGMNIHGKSWSLLEGTPHSPIEDISMSDINLRLGGAIPAEDRLDEIPYPSPRYGWAGGVPYGMYARHVHGLRMRSVRVSWDETAEGWRSSIFLDTCRDVELNAVHAAVGQTDHAESIRTRNVQELT